MINRWQEIWGRRYTKNSAELSLEKLIALDGFDSGAGRIDIKDWRTNASLLAARIGVTDHQSVFEIGCGGGAFLSALSEIHELKIGGADYSSSAIEVAKRALPSGHFQCIEARNIESEPKYDHVISHSVFLYFGLDYAREVLEQMLAKARKTICVFDVPDNATKSASERIRRAAMGKEEYERMYAGLEHTYYDRTWFHEWALRRGAHQVEIIPSLIPNYAQSRFRFGCIIRI